MMIIIIIEGGDFSVLCGGAAGTAQCCSTGWAATSHSLQVRVFWGQLAKAAVQREVKATNAATDLMAAESPNYQMLQLA